MVVYEYTTLEDTLESLVDQAVKDIRKMKKRLPKHITRANQLFYYLLPQLTYQDDPADVELIQSPIKLFDDNYYGVPGMGDCDCFTALAICCLLAIGYRPNDIAIVLAGHNIYEAVHIYLLVDGTVFDLTNPFYGYDRRYNFKQILPLNIWLT